MVLSCEYCEIFKSTYFEKNLWSTASVSPLVVIVNTINCCTSGIFFLVKILVLLTNCKSYEEKYQTKKL